MGENWLQTYSEISLWYTEGLIQPSLVGSLLSFIFGLWNSILSQADLDLYRSRRHENATIEAPHFAFSSNLFHRQITQKYIKQLSGPEDTKFSSWKGFGIKLSFWAEETLDVQMHNGGFTTYWLSIRTKLVPLIKIALHCIALQWQLFSLKMTHHCVLIIVLFIESSQFCKIH